MITICGRRVKICTGQKSQTINICTADNINGNYDYIVRLQQPFISESTLNERSFSSIDDLIQYLRSQHFGEVEKMPGSKTSGSSQDTSPEGILRQKQLPVAADQMLTTQQSPSSWELNARMAIEQSIDQFILEFIEFPYLHRVEHSIHCELFQVLAGRKIFSRTYPMGRWLTQPIHKEWPEYIPRPENGNRRGNFDISVLAPERLRSCSFTDFREGRIQPSIVIEIGLDYDIDHLSADADKLKNSGIEDSYLIHLVRKDVVDDFNAVERFLLECGLKTAYARLTSSQAYYKLIGDCTIRSIDIPLTESSA